MSDSAFLNGVSVKPAPGIPSLPFSLLPSFARLLLRGRPGSVSRSTQASTCRCAGEPLLPTPGALGSGPSYVVSIHHRLIRPHAPVPQACCDFAFTLRRNAFAVRERLGDPCDLPYFRLPYFPYMPSTLPRWLHCVFPLYPHGDSRLPRIGNESPTATTRLCQQFPTGHFISGLHRSLYFAACMFA